MHYARSSRKTGNRAPGGKGKGPRPYHQRCAIRVTYLKNKTRGQWKAHGRYLARESATFKNDAEAVGFSRENEAADIARDSWKTGRLRAISRYGRLSCLRNSATGSICRG